MKRFAFSEDSRNSFLERDLGTSRISGNKSSKRLKYPTEPLMKSVQSLAKTITGSHRPAFHKPAENSTVEHIVVEDVSILGKSSIFLAGKKPLQSKRTFSEIDEELKNKATSSRIDSYLKQKALAKGSIVKAIRDKQQKWMELNLKSIKQHVDDQKAAHSLPNTKKLHSEVFHRELALLASANNSLAQKPPAKRRAAGNKIIMHREQAAANKHASSTERNDSVERKSKIFGMSNTGVREMNGWELLLEELKEYLRLFVGNPDDEKPLIDILKDISRNNPACDLLGSYLEKPDLIDRLQDQMICISPDLPKNIRLLMADIKDYLVERKQEYWVHLRNKVKIRDRLATISKSKLQTKMLEKEFMIRSKETPKRFLTMHGIATEDFLGFLKQKPSRQNEPLSKKMDDMDYQGELKLNMVNDFVKLNSKLNTHHQKTLKDPITETELADPNLGLSKGIKEILDNNRDIRIALLDPATIGVPSDPDATRYVIYQEHYDVQVIP